jgi:hypothetical protein
MKHWRDRTGKRAADPATVKRVEHALRPAFHVVPSLRARAEDVDAQCERLTADQIDRLELIEEADRVIVRGGAGTGKTFLALETLRTHLAAGDRSALLVPTEELCAYLAGRPGIAGHVFVVGDRPVDQAPFDVLVVDEAQDVLDFAGLEQLSSWVAGGLEAGRWRIFIDENHQAALTGRCDPDAIAWLSSLGATPARLRTNCRNTGEIVEHVGMVTGADIGVPTVASGPGVDICFADDAHVAAKLLGAHLRRLEQSGVRPDEVAIVTTAAPDVGCVALLPQWLRQRLIQLDARTAAEVPAGMTVIAHPAAIKGLENRFVCVVDVESLDADSVVAAEIYVAMTRARAGLWICLSSALQERVEATVAANLRKGRGK